MEQKSNKKIIFMMGVITIMLLFKVYIANQTYLISRDIQKITANINALKEERNILQLKIEKLKYKNQIIDPLFTYKPKEPTDAKPLPEVKDEKVESNSKIVANPTEKQKESKKHKSTKELFETLETEESF